MIARGKKIKEEKFRFFPIDVNERNVAVDEKIF